MIHIQNKGHMISTNNLEPNVNKIEWDGEYNGKDGVLNIKSQTNGDNKEVSIEFDNNDLATLLTMPSVNEPLPDRLKTAFLEEEEEKEVSPMRDDLTIPQIVELLSTQSQKPNLLTPVKPVKSIKSVKSIIKPLKHLKPMVQFKPMVEMDILTPRRRHTKKYVVYGNKQRRTKHHKMRPLRQQLYRTNKTKKQYPNRERI